jgi:hypothetical protein
MLAIEPFGQVGFIKVHPNFGCYGTAMKVALKIPVADKAPRLVSDFSQK